MNMDARVTLSGPVVEGKHRRIIASGLVRVVRKIALVGEGLTKEQLYKPAGFPEVRHGLEEGILRQNVYSGVPNTSKAQAVINFTGGRGREMPYAGYINRLYNVLPNTVKELPRKVNIGDVVEQELTSRLR